MKITFGNVASFAILIEMISVKPKIYGKTSIVLNNTVLGKFGEENIITPFIFSLYRIAVDNDALINRELFELDREDAFNKIYAFYDNPDAIYDLSDKEASAYAVLNNINYGLA